MTAPLVEFRSVGLAFDRRTLFSNVSFSVEPGGSLAIVGREGSGKTSILKLCLGMILPTEGEVLIDGQDTRDLSPAGMKALRTRVGFIQQAGGLLANLTILDNILLPLRYHNLCDEGRQSQVHLLALSLDLAHHLGQLPGELSETVQKRARLARALALRPRLVLADHPLAGVTEDVANSIVEHLGTTRTPPGTAVLSTSHTLQGARRLARTVCLLENRSLRPA